ncbi:SGNH/GDSL hydrolase family protein [Listeria seeligeri]|uniref:SGNH/GDSL hydrolase family protein n=1 Tax=Listeria seeligeri TaxID=1640 RepID=UPI00162583EF|nr:SGNH/GDSL hydrolase family protein [Listeria seeligeri]MBC1721526.1 SGNH/GDSL hydrolase family protein [Listeria seeligeri]MBC1727012.1 SGNH/GDSL hydrolase family protein [Listeria seeligeri]MBC1734190.1 SGNH/GDSL hydrolase family protein [Listeria seeligeri]MBC1858657.1 SGNH/GDSL hydrolase family protein [Listeria seeligeri]MBF2366115.1 SGNH/GDSL hydrolase family protein [Listeria seeligeri]
MKKTIQSVGIWGDSIMKGVLFNPEKNRYTLLKNNCIKRASEKLGITFQNHSTMGRTITKGHEILTKDLAKDPSNDIAIIEFGGNDCDFNWAEVSENPEAPHIPGTPIDIFETQLREMIARLKNLDIQPILMTLPPLHAKRYFDFITRSGLNKENILAFLGGDVQMIYRWQERYSNTISKIAGETGSHLIDIRDSFLAEFHYEDLLCIDGIHPNEAGHIKMSRKFVQYASLHKSQ